MIDTKIVMMGIGCLTLLEIIALFNGVNGRLFSIVVAVIAMAIGVVIPKPGWIK